MAPPLDPGMVRIRLRCRDGVVAGVAVASQRPAVARALRGQEAEKAVALVPLMFSLCSKAQGMAARLALAAARGQSLSHHHDGGVAREIAGEHLWRLLMDWPRAVNLTADEATFIQGRRRLAEPGFPAWARQCLGDDECIIGKLLARLGELPEPKPAANHLLPELDAAATVALWPRLDEAFAAAPTHAGAAAETGALARRAADDGRDATPIAARVRARAEELFSLAPGRVSAVTVAAGVGRAAVETARGLLLHELTLDGDRVADYVIVAPTEWNFHPAGPLAAWLSGLPAAAAAEIVPRAVLALDPCVPWSVDVVQQV